jgi:hypothetical protein
MLNVSAKIAWDIVISIENLKIEFGAPIKEKYPQCGYLY